MSDQQARWLGHPFVLDAASVRIHAIVRTSFGTDSQPA
jgi:hypothetical protein